MPKPLKAFMLWLFTGGVSLALTEFFLGIGAIFGLVVFAVVLTALIPIDLWIEYDLKRESEKSKEQKK